MRLTRPRPRKPGLELSQQGPEALRLEPWWNADRRARPQRRVGASRPLRGANRTRWCGHETLRLSAFRFLRFFRHCERKRSNPALYRAALDCFVAFAPRNDDRNRWLFDIAACKTPAQPCCENELLWPCPRSLRQLERPIDDVVLKVGVRHIHFRRADAAAYRDAGAVHRFRITGDKRMPPV